MSAVAGSSWVLWCALAVLVAGCGHKTPEQIEADKRKADEAWQAEMARAERARQEDEDRLVREQLAAHQHNVQADDARAAQEEGARRRRAQERRLDLLRVRLAHGETARFANLRWNSMRDALCGEVVEQGMNGRPGEPHGFIVNAAEAVIDRDKEHDRFAALAARVDCAR